jgi:hypothetical protein
LGNSCGAKSLLATITLEYSNERTAEAVADAVSPDNFKTPVGVQVKTTRIGCLVVSEVNCEGKLATFIATIDDLLFSSSTAEKTLKAINR